jgi:hypothetical protein
MTPDILLAIIAKAVEMHPAVTRRPETGTDSAQRIGYHREMLASHRLILPTGAESNIAPNRPQPHAPANHHHSMLELCGMNPELFRRMAERLRQRSEADNAQVNRLVRMFHGHMHDCAGFSAVIALGPFVRIEMDKHRRCISRLAAL